MPRTSRRSVSDSALKQLGRGRLTPRQCVAVAIAEVLETRQLLTAVTNIISVNDTADRLDNASDANIARLGANVTLRDAINAANNTGQPTTIELAKGATYDFTTVDNNWYGPNALPPIESNITIDGNGATLQRDSSLAQTTAGAFRFFYVSGGIATELPLGTLTLNNLTMTNGLAKGGDSFEGGGGGGMGGAIFNQGNTTLNGVTLYNNTAHGGNSDNDSLLDYGNEQSTTNLATGGGGIGQDAPFDNSNETGWGGGFGGNFPAGVYGGKGNVNSGTGGGFDADGTLENSGGYSGLGGDNAYGQSNGGDGGNGEENGGNAKGGDFGFGGQASDVGAQDATYGGSGGVGAGGAVGKGNSRTVFAGGNGGFGGGGGSHYYVLPDNEFPESIGGDGGFGGGGGAGTDNSFYGLGGFGGGNGDTEQGDADADSGGGGAGMGGAVFSMYGSLTVVNSTLTANTAQGGIAFPASKTGTLETNATGGSGFGGAIFNLDGTADIESSTIVNNVVAGGEGGNGSVAGYGNADGGALYNLAFGSNYDTGAGIGASATINNSILYGTTLGTSGGTSVGTSGGAPNDLVNFEQNTVFTSDSAHSPQPNNGDPVSVTGTAPNVIGTYSTDLQDAESTFNLPDVITSDPKLGALADNGGPTYTMALGDNSSAIGAGTPMSFVTTDQRGIARPAQAPDIGAFETSRIYTITVNDTADRLDNTSTANIAQLGSNVTLRDAINAANNTGGQTTIELASGATYDFTTVDNNWYGPNALPPIQSNITIQGNGATLQRDSSLPQTTAGAFRFFYVSGGIATELPLGTLTLNNLTMTNGLAKGGNSLIGGGGGGMGGAIFNQGDATLSGVTLYNNTALGGSSGDNSLTDLYDPGNEFTEYTTHAATGGGGIGQDAPFQNSNTYGWGGGFGGDFADGVYGGKGTDQGTGGGFDADGQDDTGGGYSGLGGDSVYGQGLGGDGGSAELYGEGTFQGGDFGFGGQMEYTYPQNYTQKGGGGGVGGGGATSYDDAAPGGDGGFGGGGGSTSFFYTFAVPNTYSGGDGGFGGGGGAGGTGGDDGLGDEEVGLGGFGGGNGASIKVDPDSGGGGAGMGGAVFSMYGSLTVVNSTLTANTAKGGDGFNPYLQTDATGGSGYGGAIFNLDGSADIESSTIANNTVTGGKGGPSDGSGDGSADGGALYNLAYGSNKDTNAAVTAAATINNSILYGTVGGTNDLVNIEFDGNYNTQDFRLNPPVNSGNVASVTGTAPNIIGASTNSSGNAPTHLNNGTLGTATFTLPGVVTADPKLGALADNGGPTFTMALGDNSPAIDAGDSTDLPANITTDQRGAGYPRIVGAATDLGAFEVQVTTAGISATPQPGSATVGTPIADQATVTGNNPGGTVTFTLYENSGATGTPLFTDTESLAGGQVTSANYTPTATETVYWIATYNGDAHNTAASTGNADQPVTITTATPSITNSAQPASATVGTSIADKATVNGGYNPTGTVTFNLYNNSSATGTPLFTDTESLSIGGATSKGYIPTATGTDYWVATYNGDSNNSSVATQSAAASVSITATTPTVTNTSVSVGSSSNPSVFGQSVKFTATVTPVTGSASPTGKVQFYVDKIPFGQTIALINGQASVTDAALAVGHHSITATYQSNSSSFIGSASTPINSTTQIVTADNTVTTLTSDHNPSTPGEKITFTATVVTLAPATGVPAGKVQFYIDGFPYLGAVTLKNGVATITDAALKGGVHNVTATFFSSSPNIANSSTATALKQIVQQSTATLKITAPPSIVLHTPFVTLCGSIAGTSPNAIKPTGTVAISASYAGKVVAFEIARVAPNGTFAATFVSAFAKVGAYTLTYTYSGDANYAGTTSTTSAQITYGTRATPPVKTKAGATVTAKVALTDDFGLNAGSSQTTLTATGIARAATPNTTLPLPAGNVPQFTYANGLYTLNLKTPGLAAGTYQLYFTASGDSVIHALQFVLS